MANVRLLELRNTYKWGGGPDKTILLSAEQHDQTRVEVVVAYVRDTSDHEFRIADKARARGLTFHEIEEHGKLDLHVLHVLQEIIQRHDINLIHSHDYKSDLFAYLVRRRMRDRRLAVLSTLHGWALLGLHGAIYWYLDLFLMRRFNHLIAVSQATKNEMVAAGVSPDLISVIHNGIDTKIWAPGWTSATSLREELNLAQAFPVIGYVGRITPEKDLETWLRTAVLIARQCPKAQFVIVGEGKDAITLDQFKQLAVTLGIAGRVHFLGYREQLVSIYADFDLFFLSSRREGICNSLLEAMAMSLPVVTTDAGGTKELVIDGQTGYLRPQGDIEGLAQTIIALVNDEALRKRMGQAGRERIEQEFSFTTRLRRIETLYERIMGLPTYPAVQRDPVDAVS